MKNIRNNSISGMITDIGRSQTSISFNEWWGKEGMDFSLYSPLENEVTNISLTRDELHCLVVAAIAANYIDAESVVKEAQEMIEESKKKEEEDAKLNSIMCEPNPLTGLGNLSVLG